MELPYNLEAEKQVLANMLASSDVLVNTLSRLDAEDFYSKEHQIIFATIQKIFEENKSKVEAPSLIDKLSIDGNLDKIGDATYIFELVDSYIDSANAAYYINSVEEKSVLRKLILACSNVVNKWQTESSGDLTNYINSVEKRITDITKKRRVEDFISMNEAFSRFKLNIAKLRSGELSMGGLRTGYNTFDNIMLGFKAGDINILAARPSVGKSALALNFLYRVSARTSKPCVFFSLEMDVDQVTNRILSSSSGVPIRKIQTGKFDRDEEDKLNSAMRELSSHNLFIDETPAIKVMDMRAKLNKLYSRFGEIGLVVVDYIGLITPDVKSKKDSSRSLELGEISAALKALARDFHCPLLVLSQLNRAVENSKDSVPQLSNLRESGSIEQDADVVMFIHRPDYGKMQDAANGENAPDDPDAQSDSQVSLIVAKNRNGRLATIDFMFRKHVGQFIEIDNNH